MCLRSVPAAQKLLELSSPSLGTRPCSQGHVSMKTNESNTKFYLHRENRANWLRYLNNSTLCTQRRFLFLRNEVNWPFLIESVKIYPFWGAYGFIPISQRKWLEELRLVIKFYSRHQIILFHTKVIHCLQHCFMVNTTWSRGWYIISSNILCCPLTGREYTMRQQHGSVVKQSKFHFLTSIRTM